MSWALHTLHLYYGTTRRTAHVLALGNGCSIRFNLFIGSFNRLNKVVLYLQIFNTKLYSFQNLPIEFILKYSLNFANFGLEILIKYILIKKSVLYMVLTKVWIISIYTRTFTFFFLEFASK